MNFNEEHIIRFKKLKFFLFCNLFLLFIVLIDLFIKSNVNVSNFYEFKNFKTNSQCLRNRILDKPVFISNKVLSLNYGESCYSLYNDTLISYSIFYYILSKSKDTYSVFSVKHNKFLFSLEFKGLVFTIGDFIFTLNNVYKILEVYDYEGNSILSLNFLSSILSIDYNNGVLVLGLSNGQICIYKHGKLIYMANSLTRNLPILVVKLSFDNRYLVVLRGSYEHYLDIIDLEGNYKKSLELENLFIKNFDPFVKMDDYYNLFIDAEKSLVIVNIQTGKIFRIKNQHSILSVSYDYFPNIYRVYFYNEIEKIISIKTYSANSLELFDNIFIRDGISSFIEFSKGILYFNDSNDLKYLGLSDL